MVDNVERQTRSRMMATIGPKDTRPELVVRRGLHRLGFRFRLHPRKLPGRPDIVLPKYRVAIFVHGCFWHRHPGCRFATTPKTRAEFWKAKFEANVERDRRKQEQLEAAGWRVLTVWECALRHDPEVCIETLAGMIRDATSANSELPVSTDAGVGSTG
ncbi:DNA mismatch endonuclease Vsr [Wenzhouxiangella sp. XN79A]|uniref:very short patch repair endonuclease n=1 Tax=Wenzhouxiangella sp. XN79A TaxID=2724193 RepID=UPI00144A4FED|nr:very short patch repair endonuclease [Wenzhouxiangella sp. XN79A]NKI35115.1 DNA mismatch endonuclease Vsr [Wenzhouxiangella sp. XN79A]